ncbi:hypothetical protein L6164_025474 [Bauhinia variegata]|uniref:Uncharacterized protein n=1 Tax=Bauhinia variegata TaxID=167791 RepID=A0ACB9M107_BAUVA|nr:hypothetical protein L6164_025474 [Bauhinia variegata]
MFNSRHQKVLLYLKGIIRTWPTPNCYRLQHNLSPFFLKYSTSTSDERSFVVSYLVNNFGFSPEAALKASKRLHFETSTKPDSVLTFFRDRGFSNSQIRNVIQREPSLLSCNVDRRLLPKFEFLQSIGASSSDIVEIVTKNPTFLRSSLKNHIIPSFELVRRFLKTDKKAISCIKASPTYIFDYRVTLSVELLLDKGTTNSNIARLLRSRPGILLSKDLMKVVEQVEELGIDPSYQCFCWALMAKTISKAKWDAKIDTFKRWGWSEETTLKIFRWRPVLMLSSVDKINAVMNLWVNQLGWNSLSLVKGPVIIQLSLEKRIIPRAAVVQFLLSKGLRSKNASLVTPFYLTEKMFLEKYVKCFEESSQLLELYEEKMKSSR